MTTENSLSLPMSVDGITADWLEKALQCRHPKTKIAAITINDSMAGTASKVSIRVDYDENAHALPANLYIKGGFHGEEQMALAAAGYLREVEFYQTYSNSLTAIELPHCYYAGTNADTRQSIVILEDLNEKGVTFGNATNPMSVDTMATTMEWLAKFHSTYWNNPPVEKDNAWPGVVGQVIDLLLAPDVWGAMLDRELAKPVPAALRDPVMVKKAMSRMWDIFNAQPKTFIHGDSHLGNMYFLKDGSPSFIDWQSPMAGPWSDDVTYTLIGGLTIEDRRQHEKALLQHYLSSLKQSGVAEVPTFDAAWLAYRQQVMHGFMWVGTPPNMQPDAIVGANVERFCAAVDDLETLSALGI